MAISAQILVSGAGWSVCDVVCNHGPGDRAFVEEHAETTIAAVMQGSFQYRTQAGSAVLVPGALLLGNAGSCFECGHEHAQGDRPKRKWPATHARRLRSRSLLFGSPVRC